VLYHRPWSNTIPWDGRCSYVLSLLLSPGLRCPFRFVPAPSELMPPPLRPFRYVVPRKVPAASDLLFSSDRPCPFGFDAPLSVPFGMLFLGKSLPLRIYCFPRIVPAPSGLMRPSPSLSVCCSSESPCRFGFNVFLGSSLPLRV
jgi:hypothetical protein